MLEIHLNMKWNHPITNTKKERSSLRCCFPWTMFSLRFIAVSGVFTVYLFKHQNHINDSWEIGIFHLNRYNSNENLQRTLAAIRKMNGELNIAITSKYHSTELQGEQYNFEMKKCGCHLLTHWWNLEPFILNGTARHLVFPNYM